MHSHHTHSTPEFQARDQPSGGVSDVDNDDEPFDQQAWDEWYRERIRRSIADPRPRVAHEIVMARAWQLICDLGARHGRRLT